MGFFSVQSKPVKVYDAEYDLSGTVKTIDEERERVVFG